MCPKTHPTLPEYGKPFVPTRPSKFPKPYLAPFPLTIAQNDSRLNDQSNEESAYHHYSDSPFPLIPREDHPTRLRILEVARRLFHEQGYHATGISTILRESDTNSGSLYHYFPSKKPLLTGVLTLYLDLLRPWS